MHLMFGRSYMRESSLQFLYYEASQIYKQKSNGKRNTGR